MRSIYFSLLVFLLILAGLHAVQISHFKNLARFFQLGQQWQKGHRLFTNQGADKMAACLMPLKASETFEENINEEAEYIKFIEKLLQEFAVLNMPTTSNTGTNHYSLLINKNKPVVLDFELISAGDEIRITNVKNLDVLVEYIKAYRQKAQPKKLCL